jgi:hypothetical protein
MRKTTRFAMLAAAGLALSLGGEGRLRAALQDGLVAHLKFDGNVNDSSGEGNNAIPGGTGLFFLPASSNSDGVARSPFLGTGALDLTYSDPNEFAVFSNTLTDLQFGAATDFTISVWMQRVINPDGADIGDPSIIGNKDWGGGGNQGWVIYDQDDRWGWNWKGLDGPRRDFAGRQLPAGEWHNITVTHDRDGLASFYHDGSLLGSLSIAGSGSVDTVDLGLTTNIGQDGTGAYGDKLSHNMDDMGIWRRALTASEVLTIVKEGRGGVDIAGIDEILVAGDVNEDGVTNTADYAIWNANVGFSTGAGGTDLSYSLGDADFNGVIDLGDFKIIADNASPPLGVPEPSSLLLVACGAIALGVIRKLR